MNKAIFIDKDGTLINDVPYNVDVSLITFTKGAIEALQQWKQQGFLIIVISNQPGIAHNYFTERDIKKVEEYLATQLALHRIVLDAFYYCPHHPQGMNKEYAMECNCRKPSAGLILQAARDWQIDLTSSWMIGDILNDVEAGNRAGCRTILLDNGNETEWTYGEYRTPHYKVCNLTEAAEIIQHASCKQEQWR